MDTKREVVEVKDRIGKSEHRAWRYNHSISSMRCLLLTSSDVLETFDKVSNPRPFFILDFYGFQIRED